MKKFLAITFLPFLLYACTIDINDIHHNGLGVRAEATESSIYSSAKIQRVDIKTQNGSIESSAWNDDTIHVVFDMWATGYDRQDAVRNIDDIRIYVDGDRASGVLSIDVDFPDYGDAAYGCDVFLNLPESIFLYLRSSNGAIKVSESEEGVECHTSNGAITMEDTEGRAYLRTSNGKITTRNHRGDLDAKTSNGKLDVDIVLPRHGECIMKTSNGNATLSIPDDTSAMIEASTSNGEVEIRNLDIIITEMEDTELRGRLGRGEGDIVIDTSNGNVLIKRR